MKNAALRQRLGAEGALEEAAQSEEITSSQVSWILPQQLQIPRLPGDWQKRFQTQMLAWLPPTKIWHSAAKW